MKRAIIVHCWGGDPEYCWYPSVKKDLETLGFQVTVPAMPKPDEPQLTNWLPQLKGIIGEADENLYLIGHSIGSVTIMRYLETLPENTRVGGVVLVAGFTDNIGFKELKNFFEKPFDYEKIKSRAKHFILIHSDNDPYVQSIHASILKEKLGAELIIKKGMGHFTAGRDPDDGPVICTKLPEAAAAIEKMINI